MRRAMWLMFLILFAGLVANAQAPAGTEGKFVTVYGAPIHCVERGAGPVVVLVHGLADDTGIWQASMEPLARSFRVIAVDMIGHGRSSKPLLNYRAATFADFLIGFLDAMQIERATLVGNSLGGWVSTLVALREPHRIERLVLVGAPGLPPSNSLLPCRSRH